MFDSILSFLKLTQDFNAVTRDQKSYDLARHENDSEHSYQLAMMVWYLANTMDLELDRDKLLRYALVHDFVEVYAGDSAAFSSDVDKNREILNAKAHREEEAFIKLKSEFPQFNEMMEAIEEYEKKADPESRLVYIVDKIIADLNCYLSREQYYVDRSSSLQFWVEWFNTKFKKLGETSGIEKELLDEYYNFMHEHKDFFFAS